MEALAERVRSVDGLGVQEPTANNAGEARRAAHQQTRAVAAAAGGIHLITTSSLPPPSRPRAHHHHHQSNQARQTLGVGNPTFEPTSLERYHRTLASCEATADWLQHYGRLLDTIAEDATGGLCFSLRLGLVVDPCVCCCCVFQQLLCAKGHLAAAVVEANQPNTPHKQQASSPPAAAS
jgi:hypothetical protein